MPADLPIKLSIILTIIPSLYASHFTYDELILHTPKQRTALQSRLLGYLEPVYRQGYQAYTAKNGITNPMPLTHQLMAIPAGTHPVNIQLQVNYSKQFSEDSRQTVFWLSFWDSTLTPIASCNITRNTHGFRHADGSIYFANDHDYTRPITAPILMKLRDKILTILEVPEYRLKDFSWDHHMDRYFQDNASLELRVLGAYMHGKTYYQNKAGFHVRGTPAQATKYHNAQKLLYNLTFAQVRQDYISAPIIERLATMFPHEKRFGAIVHNLYQKARKNDRSSYDLLKWIYAHCLTTYSTNTPVGSHIRKAQQLVLATTEFHKFYVDKEQ